MRNFRGLAAGLACLHIHVLKLCERALSFAVSLRKEGEVALLESPNGLGATAEFQLRGEVSRTKFPAILCRPSTSLGNERSANYCSLFVRGRERIKCCRYFLWITNDGSRRRFAHLDLRAHPLQARTKRFNLLLLVCHSRLEVLLLPCHRRF